jgi:thiol:disulfide interchange protein
MTVMKKRLWQLFIGLFISLVPLLLIASESQNLLDEGAQVTFVPRLIPATALPGENIRLVVDVQLQPEWHIYSVIRSTNPDAPPPTKLLVSDGLLIKDGPAYETPPILQFIRVLGMTIEYHSELAFLYQNLQVPKGAETGSKNLSASLTYQLCTDSICLPPKTELLKIPYTVESGKPRAAYLNADRTINALPDKMSKDQLSDMQGEGLWAFIALAALMGLVSLLTPCVFPMIPITVTFFTKQAEGKQSRVIKLASLFALGIIFTYTVVGLLLSGLFGAGSALLLATNPVVNLAIAVVFIVFALSLMGLFNLSLPAGLESFFDRRARTLGGVSGVLLMGFTFTLTAFTCTVQFVGTMLIAAAQGEWIWPLLGMLVFSTVFAFPFFLLAIAPSLIRQIQGRSGAWLGRSKVVLGILELMASIKFLSNADLVWNLGLLSRNSAILIWTLLLLVIAGYLIWTGVRPVLNRAPIQWIMVVLFASLAIVVSQGRDDRSLGSLIDAVLPPTSGLHQATGERVSADEIEKMIWLDSFSEALEQAEKSKQPIFLEFTGYTCVNCRWMEQNIFARREIHELLNNRYVRVRLFTDGGDNARKNLNLQIDRFQTVALPFYAIISPDGRLLRKHSGITLQSADFKRFLNPQSQK